MKIYIFGNGNISFSDFEKYYAQILNQYIDKEEVTFLIGDFRGADTLAMEFLKCRTTKVCIYHVSTKPRYLPDKYKTKVGSWLVLGGFENDEQRDLEAIKNCSHFIAIDFNSDAKRKSGTLKNIESCQALGKIWLTNEIA